jgi:hypothetical protein
MPGVLAVYTATDLPEVAARIPAPFGGTPSTKPYVQVVSPRTSCGTSASRSPSSSRTIRTA